MNTSNPPPKVGYYLAVLLLVAMSLSGTYLHIRNTAGAEHSSAITSAGEHLRSLFQGLGPGPRAFLRARGPVAGGGRHARGEKSPAVGTHNYSATLRYAVLRDDAHVFFLPVVLGCSGH